MTRCLWCNTSQRPHAEWCSRNAPPPLRPIVTRDAQLSLEPRQTGAAFSDCKVYRYRAWRSWDDTTCEIPVHGSPWCCFVMLNPSTADELRNDPTVERCERRARQWGYGGLMVLNLFAVRSTDPKGMLTHPDPVGPENDRHIIEVTQRIVLTGGMIVCAWGNHAIHRNRDIEARRLLAGCPLYYLRTTQAGQPEHPLYIPYSEEPKRWKGEQ